MSWNYSSAVFHGNKASPNSGDFVVVMLKDDALPDDDPGEVFKYTYSGEGKSVFRDKVKGEIRAHGKRLNSTRPVVDATTDFKPDPI